MHQWQWRMECTLRYFTIDRKFELPVKWYQNMTIILWLLSIDNGLNDHCVGWAKRSVHNINNGIFIRCVRCALPNLREDSFPFLVPACPA